MKIWKILSALALTFFASASALAAETVYLVWPFSPASNQATAIRTIIDNANKAQDKYLFVFDNRPGAGGAIGVNSVIRSEKTEVLIISSSVFVRPIFYPNESYNLADLKPLAVLAAGSPISVVSKNYKTLPSFLQAKGPSIGVVAGSVTEVVARQLKAHNPSIILVPYPGTINATRDAAGGHIDASVEFIKDATPWVTGGLLSGLGATGERDAGPFKSFQSQGISGLSDLSISFYALVKSTMPAEKVNELNEVLVQANSQANVTEIWAGDHATRLNTTVPEATKLWNRSDKFWAKTGLTLK
jgi:tripartite-type tricarboxylate transporter receptor subunit TctC